MGGEDFGINQRIPQVNIMKKNRKIIRGIFKDPIMGDVPVMREYSSKYGMWEDQWFVDTKKIKINLLTELKVIYLQIANLYRRFCIDGPQAYKFLRETTTAEAANAAKMRFIETMINDENVARKEVEQFLFEYLENSWMHMNFENIEDWNIRTVRISECFWEENLAELKKRCNKNPKMKKALIDTATKTFRELLIQMKGQDRQSGQCKILHRSSIKYLDEIKPLLSQLGFKDTPLIKAARPKRAAAKAKQKKSAESPTRKKAAQGLRQLQDEKFQPGTTAEAPKPAGGKAAKLKVAKPSGGARMHDEGARAKGERNVRGTAERRVELKKPSRFKGIRWGWEWFKFRTEK